MKKFKQVQSNKKIIKMKTIKLVAITLGLSMGLISCSSDDDGQQMDNDPLADFNLVTKLEGNGHTIELYSELDGFITGYNEIYIRIKDNADDNYFTDAEITWMPVMYMM